MLSSLNSSNQFHSELFGTRTLVPGKGLLDSAAVQWRVREESASIFDLMAAELGERQVLYLEFGVWKGDSIRHWAGLLKNPCSMLHGFDSFEGLPEEFNIAVSKFAFSTHGVVPTVGDTRVKFFKGWFEDTLAKYSVPEHDVLVANLDADLYSSTKTVLHFLKSHIDVKTYLYFDEFNDRHHELRAFDEFLNETDMTFRVVGANQILSHVCFRRIA